MINKLMALMNKRIFCWVISKFVNEHANFINKAIVDRMIGSLRIGFPFLGLIKCIKITVCDNGHEE